MSLALGAFINGNLAPFYVAEEDGLFRRNGLDVTLVPAKGSATVLSQLAGGKYTFAYADAGVLMQEVAKGAPVKMVFDLIRESPDAIVYPANSGIKTPKDLEGRSVAFVPGGAAPTLLPTFFHLAGVNASRVRLIGVRPVYRNSLLLEHKVAAIDALWTTEHALLLAHGLRTNEFSYASVGLNLPGPGVIARRTTVTQHPKTVRALLNAVAEGMKAAESNPLAAVKAVKTLAHVPDFKVSSNVIVLKDTITTWTSRQTKGKPLGWMPPQQWTSSAKILEAKMGLKPFNVSTAYTDDFIPHP